MSRKLTVKQQHAAVMMAEGITYPVIKKQLNLQHNTLTRWQRIPEFQDAITQHVRDLQQSMSYRLLAMRCDAFDQMEKDFMPLYPYRNFKEIRMMLDDVRNIVNMQMHHIQPQTAPDAASMQDNAPKPPPT